jgi:hypothetical protein
MLGLELETLAGLDEPLKTLTRSTSHCAWGSQTDRPAGKETDLRCLETHFELKTGPHSLHRGDYIQDRITTLSKHMPFWRWESYQSFLSDKLLAQLNRKIDDLNLIVPFAVGQRVHLRLENELRRLKDE